MANTIAVSQAHPISPKHAHVGLVLLSVVTSDSYVTASGGFSVDLTTPLADLKIAYSDVLALTPVGPTLTGHMPVAIKTSTAGTFTIKLWNGSTEISNGALTQTLQLMLWYNQGATS